MLKGILAIFVLLFMMTAAESAQASTGAYPAEAAENAESEAVREVLQNYIDGTYHADAAKLKGVFHEKAVMNGYLGPNLLLADPSPFIEDITGAPSMQSNDDPYRAEINNIHVEGNVASATIIETGFRGEVSFMNFFQLIKIDGAWYIISKLFTTL